MIRFTPFVILGSSVLLAAPSKTTHPDSLAQDSRPEEGVIADFDHLEEVNSLYKALMGAYMHNPELVSLRHQFKGQLENIKQANADFFPRVDAEAGLNQVSGILTGSNKGNNPQINQPSGTQRTQRTYSLSITQNLFKGWGSLEALKAADFQVQAAAYELKAKEQEVFMQVIESFLEIIRLKADIEATEASLKAFSGNLEVAQNRMRIGEETQTQVALAQTRLSDVKARLDISKASFEAVKASFMALTGCKPGKNLLTPTLPESDLKKLSDILAQTSNNLEVLTAMSKYRSVKHQVAKQKSEWYPTVDLQARSDHNNFHGVSDFTTSNQSSLMRQTNHQVGIAVKYNLFNGGASVSKINQAHAAAASKKVDIEGARYKARQAIIKAFEAYQSARLNVESFETQVSAARIALDGMRQEMLAGIRILVDVLQRQSELLDAEKKLIEARKTCVLEGFRLMSLVGRLNVDQLSLPVKPYQVQTKFENTKSNIPDSQD